MQHQILATRQGCHDSESTLVHPLDTAVLRNWTPRSSQRVQMVTWEQTEAEAASERSRSFQNYTMENVQREKAVPVTKCFERRYNTFTTRDTAVQTMPSSKSYSYLCGNK